MERTQRWGSCLLDVLTDVVSLDELGIVIDLETPFAKDTFHETVLLR